MQLLMTSGYEILHSISCLQCCHCTMCPTLPLPTICLSNAMQKFRGILTWNKDEGFEAGVVRCGHMKLHMMQKDEEARDAELLVTPIFGNPKFSEEDIEKMKPALASNVP